MKNIKAHLALFGAQLIYGINYSVSKEAMPDYVLPFAFILIRVVGALPLLWLTSLHLKEKMERKDIWKMAYLGIFGVALNQLLFYKGLNETTPINASIIMVSNPIIVLMLTAVILKEKITRNKMTGIFLGIAGALALLLFNKDLSFGSETLRGDIMILINSTSFALYIVLVKPLMKKYNTITILKWVFFFGLFYIFPFGYSEYTQVNWSEMPLNIILCVAFVVICTTYFAYILNTYALKDLSPTVVSFYIYMQPFLASIIAIWMGKDEIDVIKIASAFLIIAGVYFVSKPQKEINE